MTTLYRERFLRECGKPAQEVDKKLHKKEARNQEDNPTFLLFEGYSM